MTVWDDVRAKPCIFKSAAQVLNHTTMAPSITSAFASFLQSLSGIGVSILSAVIGVLYAFLALGQTLFASVVQLGQSVLKRECKYLVIRSMSLMCRIRSGYGCFPRRLWIYCWYVPSLAYGRAECDQLDTTANFFVLFILGGGYYWYTQNQKRQIGGGKRKR
jgi:hypothetical protein